MSCTPESKSWDYSSSLCSPTEDSSLSSLSALRKREITATMLKAMPRRNPNPVRSVSPSNVDSDGFHPRRALIAGAHKVLLERKRESDYAKFVEEHSWRQFRKGQDLVHGDGLNDANQPNCATESSA